MDVAFVNTSSGNTVQKLMAEVSTMSKRERQNIVRKLKKLLSQDTAKLDELRIPACKLLVSLVPESIEVIVDLLKEKSDKTSREVHFSLFCFLNELQFPSVPLANRSLQFVEELPGIIGEYLHNVSTETGKAAWMAGDLLGDHWASKSALLILLREAKGARYVAGRRGAIQGLLMALHHASQKEKQEIRNVLREISKHDRSESVRDKALWALER